MLLQAQPDTMGASHIDRCALMVANTSRQRFTLLSVVTHKCLSQGSRSIHAVDGKTVDCGNFVVTSQVWPDPPTQSTPFKPIPDLCEGKIPLDWL